MKNEQKISYSEAKQRLQDIVTKMESTELNIDDLSSCVKEATELIEVCRKKLQETDIELQAIYEKMND